ncbi:MetQ/NlpA family ABC transporter substrate-binding protein [Staphylococcus hominis]|uniref:MetQ/NlpA family ABC transporter substrate-binding protein n=1 Tax=Staphylococcus hominis TaxID=1290 RepID=UPI0031BA6270
MKKLIGMISIVLVIITLTACGNQKEDNKKITVAASPAPHGDVLKKGYDLEVKEVNDYKVPNKLLDKGDVDANFFQHVPYLNAEKKSHGYKIEELGKVFTTPMGVYSKKYKNLKDIPDGSTIYVSNNPAEEGRFLSFFVNEGLIKLKKGVKIENAKFEDIAENKKHLKFNHQQGAEFLPKTYENGEGAAVIINSNYALDNGLKPSKDAIVMEGKSSPFANTIAVQEGHKNDEKFQTLLKVMQSKEIKAYIKKEYGDDVIPYENK